MARSTTALLLACVAALGPRAAHARDDAGPPELRPLPWTRWALFDPILDPRSALVDGGWARVPAAEGTSARGALHLALGDGIRTEWPWTFVELERRLGVIAARPDALLVELPCYTMWGGLRARPVELGAGAGLCGLGVDGLTHGVAFSFLSPSASLRATITTSRVRVSALASIEYLWRWFGRADLAVRALSLEVSFVQPPAEHLGTHPVIVTTPASDGAAH